jgi:hypothetical protein
MANYIVTQSTDPGQTTICTNAKVGIGTTSPAQALSVSGTIRAHYSGDNRYRSDHYVGSDSKAHINAYDDTGAVYLPIYIDGSVVLINPSTGGKVGISTTSPSNKLNVDTSGISCDGIALTQDGNPRGYLARTGGDEQGGDGFLELTDRTGTKKIQLYSGEHDSYLNYGKVGIGTTQPNSTLQVNGSVAGKRTFIDNIDYTSSNEAIIGVLTSSSAVTVTLATTDAVAGRILIIKDEGGYAATRNITIARNGRLIDNVASNKVINTNYGVIRLYSDGTNWFMF